MVGALDRMGGRSSFSNFGDCVDVFAPGESVVAPVTGEWLVPMYGTSFSAPLVARWLTRQEDLSLEDPGRLQRELLRLRDKEKRLPGKWFPSELMWNPEVGQALSQPAAADTAWLRGAVTHPTLRSPALAPLFWRLQARGKRRLMGPGRASFTPYSR